MFILMFLKYSLNYFIGPVGFLITLWASFGFAFYAYKNEWKAASIILVCACIFSAACCIN